LHTPDFEKLKREQGTDPFLAEIIRKVKLGQLIGKYVLENELLYRLLKHPAGLNKLLVVPESMQEELVRQYHSNEKYGNHLGITLTTLALRKKYYWLNMVRTVAAHINNCVTCLLYKSYGHPIKPALKAIEPPSMPWQKVYVDLAGPFPPTYNGNLYILAFVEVSTNWIECFAIPKVDSKVIADLYVK